MLQIDQVNLNKQNYSYTPQYSIDSDNLIFNYNQPNPYEYMEVQSNLSDTTYTKKSNSNIKTDFYGVNFEKYKDNVPKYVNQLINRNGTKGQYLNWINLPQEQLQKVDDFYSLAENFKNVTNNKKMVVLGIGGSKHPIEHMLSINGLNISNSDIEFYSDIDSISFNRLIKALDNDITSANFLIVSKSGSTFETKDGFLRIKNKLIETYKKQGNSDEEALQLANRHFIAVTDTDENKSQLRNIANSEGWLGSLKIHDDVGGRFSAFDDHVLFSLAYAGMKKEDMIKMLKSAQEVSSESLSYDLDKNIALKEAIFWSNAKINGIENAVHEYFGSVFENTINWATQMHNESIKDTNKQISKIPDAMHHSAEAHFNPKNKYAFALTVLNDNGDSSENVEKYIEALVQTYSEQGQFFIETLDSSDYGINPEAVGRLTQMRAFSTIYEEIVNKIEKWENIPKTLESVLQPNVETYKRNLKGLVPGKINKN